jgi:hypothetical protein
MIAALRSATPTALKVSRRPWSRAERTAVISPHRVSV